MAEEVKQEKVPARIFITRRVNGKEKDLPGCKKIVPLTASSPHYPLSPYSLKDENGHIIENVYQGNKVYAYIPPAREFYSKYNKKVIWEHPEEVHVDENGYL